MPEFNRAPRTVLELKLLAVHLLHEIPGLRVAADHRKRLIRDLPTWVGADDPWVLQPNGVEHLRDQLRTRVCWENRRT